MYADVELLEASLHYPDNIQIIKASRLVQCSLQNIRLEFKHQPLTKIERSGKGLPIYSTYKWTADDVHFIELVYGLIESKSIENGNVKINEFANHLGAFLGIELRDSHDTYSSSIKRRNKDDRAYFLNKLAYVLNKKMNHEDQIPPPTLPAGHTKTLFDDM